MNSPPDEFAPILRAFYDRQPTVARDFVQEKGNVSRLGLEPGHLISLLDDEDSEVRLLAICLLSELDPEQEVTAPELSVESPDKGQSRR